MISSWQLKNPYDFLTEMGFDLPDKNQSLDQYLNYIDEDMLEDIGTNKEMIYASYKALHGQLEEELEVKVKSIL